MNVIRSDSDVPSTHGLGFRPKDVRLEQGGNESSRRFFSHCAFRVLDWSIESDDDHCGIVKLSLVRTNFTECTVGGCSPNHSLILKIS